MGLPVLILGDSGTGKSTSMRTLDPEKTSVINVLGKRLPFRNEFTTFTCRDIDVVMERAIPAIKTPVMVIDDFGYLITDLFTRHSYGADKYRDQYEVYKEIGAKIYQLVNELNTTVPDDTVCYLTMHIDRDQTGNIVPATVGRMLNEKINLVGMFTIVLLSTCDADGYWFITNQTPPAKSPIGLFESEKIPNNLGAVDDAIRGFWGLGG